MLPQNTVLLLIDVQVGFDNPAWGPRNNPQAEDNMVRLLDHWRQTKRPVIHVQHISIEPGSPLGPDQPGSALKAAVSPLPGERVIQKNVNSAFIGTDLETLLHDQGYDTVVMVGLTTNHCVSTTARMAGNLGFTGYVVDDATATFDRAGHDGTVYPAQTVHALALASLHGEFATVTSTDTILAES
ncbi:cysteine hydrolase family protein [Chloroflexota bacterium]